MTLIDSCFLLTVFSKCKFVLQASHQRAGHSHLISQQQQQQQQERTNRKTSQTDTPRVEGQRKHIDSKEKSFPECWLLEKTGS